MLKSTIFDLKSLLISCEFNIPDVIAFYAFLRQFKTSLCGTGCTKDG